VSNDQTPEALRPWAFAPSEPLASQPLPSQPLAAQPLASQPLASPPMHQQPASGPPSLSPTSFPPAAPASSPAMSDPASEWGNQPVERWRPRIEPSPPRRRGGLVIGLLIGLLVGLLVAGPAGYLLNGRTAERSSNGAESASPGASGTAALPPFEASQLALNRTKFTGDLAELAEPWLPWMGGCLRNTDPRGPKLRDGEQARVFCRLDAVGISFVLYASMAERDKAHLARQRQNIDAQQLAPGAAGPSRKSGASGRTTGDYLEYAYRSTAGDGWVFCGIWWTKEKTPATVFMEAAWKGELGGSWEPLRNLWQRYT